ncbi:MAG TPA: DUF502 domain-containing protein [Gemmatimonadaceae bacterium]|nr:DUF502 domain-containing protein [Gemmatimonadaceae bacterium]
MKAFLNYFLRGLVVTAPVALTIYITVYVFVTIDQWLGFTIPGVGFAITIGLITLVGFLASNLLTRGLVNLVESVMARLPFVRLLYTSTKDLLNAFVGEKRRFDKPVIVQIVAGGTVRALGFVTQESLTRLGAPGDVAVYFPQSYNFAGQMLLVSSSHVQRLDVPSSDVMAFVVSGGVTRIGEGKS